MTMKVCNFRISEYLKEFIVEAVQDFKAIGDLLENIQSFKIPKSTTLVSL